MAPALDYTKRLRFNYDTHEYEMTVIINELDDFFASREWSHPNPDILERLAQAFLESTRKAWLGELMAAEQEDMTPGQRQLALFDLTSEE